jgi:transcriptional regulator with XRE-family HTH domain
MHKSVYTDEYQVVVEILRELRSDAAVTQVELAEILDQSQSFVSKYERGDRRLDIIQLRTVCEALGSSLQEFVNRLEQRLIGSKTRRRQRRPSRAPAR